MTFPQSSSRVKVPFQLNAGLLQGHLPPSPHSYTNTAGTPLCTRVSVALAMQLVFQDLFCFSIRVSRDQQRELGLERGKTRQWDENPKLTKGQDNTPYITALPGIGFVVAFWIKG